MLVVGASALQAQTSPGDMMVGGGLNFSSTSHQGGSTSNSVEFSPGVGYFVSDNFAVGATLTISSERDGTGAGKRLTSAFGLGPFARYYIFTSNERFGFFGQAHLGFVAHKTDPPVGAVVKGNEISFALSPGAVYFFNEHWAAEFMIRGFALTSRDPNTDNDNDKYTMVEFGLNSLMPTLGFRYHF